MDTLAFPLETAHRHQRNGEFPKAERCCRQVLRGDPYNAEAAFLLATACQAQNKPREALTHLEHALRIRPEYAEARHARALVFAGRGDINEAVEELRRVIELKPDYPEAHHNLGVALARSKRLGPAIAAFRQAMQCKPDYMEAITNLAHSCEESGRLDDAVAAYQDWLRLSPLDADVHNSLGLVYAKKKALAEAAEAFEEASGLDPVKAIFRNNLGAALADMGRPAEALEHFNAAVDLEPEYAEAHKNRGMNLLQLGDFELGWSEYEWRWKSKEFQYRTFPQPAWDGIDSLDGKRILLYTEQGIGDTFQFVRYATVLAERGADVILECPKVLIPLLKTCPGIKYVVASGAVPPHPRPLSPGGERGETDFDYHATLMSVARLVGTRLENIPAQVPYLYADKELVERWGRELDGARRLKPAATNGTKTVKVGIVWQGNPKNGSDYRRSIPLEQFAPLAAVPGVELYSLQKGYGTDQLARVIGDFPIIDLGGRLDYGSFMVTAAAITNLDLVITCDTACGHLAGALGKPVWLALATATDWRWLMDRNDSPWYPTMRLFRQPIAGDWETVFERMAERVASGELNAGNAPAPLVGVERGS